MQVHGLSINIHGTKSCPPSKLMTPHAKESDKGQSGTVIGMRTYRVHIWKIVLPGSLSEQRRMDHTAERWGWKLWNGLAYHSPWQTANTIKSSLTMACNKVCNTVLYLLSVKRGKFAYLPLESNPAIRLHAQKDPLWFKQFVDPAHKICKLCPVIPWSLFSQCVSFKAFKIKDWLLK